MSTSTLKALQKDKASQANVMRGILIFALASLTLIWLLPSGGLDGLLKLLGRVSPVIYWCLTVLAIAASLGLIGRAATGRWAGVLIDSTHRMSLSRLQVTLWTVLVLSTYLMVALPRIFGPLIGIDGLDPNDPSLKACMDGKPPGYVPTVEGCGGGPLQITFPPQLVVAMGISLASFAGSRLIQTSKSNQTVDLAGMEAKQDQAQRRHDEALKNYNQKDQAAKQAQVESSNAQEAYDLAKAQLDSPPAGAGLDALQNGLAQAKLLLDATKGAYEKAFTAKEQALKQLNAAEQALEQAVKGAQASQTQAEGVLQKNDSFEQASWSDLFRGILISNCQQVDIGKVQMFFFTLVVLLAYAAALGALLHNGPALLHPLGISFPPFSDSLNGLLAISHGTYLTGKTVAQN